MKSRERILALLEDVYKGKPWYGKNVFHTLRDLPVGKSVLRLNGSYNIAEIIHHMLVWRRYTIQVLRTGVHTEVEEKTNFPEIEVMLMEEWRDLIMTFEESQSTLHDAIETSTFDFSDQVKGKPYSISHLVEGVIHHDIYHAGQLNLLAKFL